MPPRHVFTEKDFDWEASFSGTRDDSRGRTWTAALTPGGNQSSHLAASSTGEDSCTELWNQIPRKYKLQPVAASASPAPPSSTQTPAKKVDQKAPRVSEPDFEFHLPKLRSEDDSGKRRSLGPGFAVGVGCGAGIGVAVSGGAGFGRGPWNNIKMVFGIGVGCGIGVGYGYGYGFGFRLDKKPGGLPTKRMVLEL